MRPKGHPESMRLADYQDAFARALFAPIADAQRSIGAGSAAAAVPRAPETADVAVARLAAQPGFAVYRNTVLKGAIDAVEANYPAVTRLVGGEWLRAAAAAFVRAQPPVEPSLLHYGAGFADFLAGFAPAVDMPWLAGVARLDRAWTEAHVAADESPVDAATSRRSPPRSSRGRCCVRTRRRAGTSPRTRRSARCGSATGRARRTFPTPTSAATSTGAAKARCSRDRRDVVEAVALDAAGAAFLDACAARGTLADAAAAALAADPATDLARLMATLLAAGAFGRLETLPESTEDPACAQ